MLGVRKIILFTKLSVDSARDNGGGRTLHAASVPAAAGSAPIEYLEASVTELPLDDGSFDVAICQQGMPFFTDRPRAADHQQQ